MRSGALYQVSSRRRAMSGENNENGRFYVLCMESTYLLSRGTAWASSDELSVTAHAKQPNTERPSGSGPGHSSPFVGRNLSRGCRGSSISLVS